MPRRTDSSDPHGWSTLDRYLLVHARRMDDFRSEGFVLEDDLTFDFQRADRFIVEGRIRCQGRLFVDVAKVLAVRGLGGRRQVRTIKYAYHVGIEGPRSRSVFRYDNSHSYVREGHPDPHHKHRFDYGTWQEITPPEWIGADRWPHLSDVIDELRLWRESTGQFLDPETGEPG